ncbi:MAG: hypothetical protein AB4040_16250 [Synechococcus sp.]
MVYSNPPDPSVKSERFLRGGPKIKEIDGTAGEQAIDRPQAIAPHQAQSVIEMAVYAGFPAALNDMSVLKEVLAA